MERKLYESKLQIGLEETSRIRTEIRAMMDGEPIIQNIRNYFVSKGVDTTKVDIILNQAFKDKEEKEKLLQLAKKRRIISIIFLIFFLAGVSGWFYIWGDWITYFAGINLVLFLFFLQQAASLRGKAEVKFHLDGAS